MDKVRLDVILKNKFGYSRQYSKQIITDGKVKVNNYIAKKPSVMVDENDIVEVAENSAPKYVGRGGFKLEGAINYFDIKLDNSICIDIGASTGGFTDCMLQNGAKKVFAVDVGSEQLAEKLKNDSRVISIEQTDIRNVTKDKIDETNGVDFISVDVSFISVKKIAESIKNLLSENGTAVILIKPQFEAGRENISKNGIVKNPKVHKKVLKELTNFLNENQLFIKGITVSPIKGGEGNIEYLVYITKNVENMISSIEKEKQIDMAIMSAENLKGK